MRAAMGPGKGLVLLVGAVVAVAGGCAGSTVGSGVGDRWLERSPYYAGRWTSMEGASIGHLPVAYQAGATQPELFDPRGGAGSRVAALLARMNAYLDDLGATLPVGGVGAAGGSGDLGPGSPPDVSFGCEVDPLDECGGGEIRSGSKPRMRLAVARPSSSWVAWAGDVMDRTDVEYILVFTLEVGQYWPRQTNLRGSKAVDLGTGYEVPLPWLTGLDTPVQVLQVTGALVGRDGRAVAIGAEGLVARRTNVVLSSMGVRALISDDDVAALEALQRDDLPGRPLVWQEALRNLVEGLTGRRLDG
jgi:hypothetical protein